MAGTVYGERIASLEVEVKELKTSFDSHKGETNERFDRLEAKIDDLLALKNKGYGAFWLVSLIVGSGVITGLVAVFNWWRS